MDRFGESPADGVPAADLTAGADGVFGAGNDLGRSLERWAADARVDEAARTRVRNRWLRIQAEEEASLVGTLLDLAERRRPVVLEVGDHRYRGVLAGVGGDFIAARTDHGQQVLVRLDALDTIRSEPGGADVRGDRPPMLDIGLDAVLGPIAADRPEVLARTRTGAMTRGRLLSAGADVVRIRADGDPPTPVWIPTAAIASLVIDT